MKQDERLLKDMPTDIRLVYKFFDLDPVVTVLATCPQPLKMLHDVHAHN